jgi:curli biogenesis system outer membrane secretion channel CsgG
MGKVLGVRYIVAGSITKFATSDRKFGGGKAGAVARGVLGPIGGLSFRKTKQEVTLTARLIDTTTGEVVASAKGEGVANKGQGASVELQGGVGFSTQSPEFRASGIGEAQERAISQLAVGLLAHVTDLSAELPKPDPTPTPPPPAPTPTPAKALNGKKLGAKPAPTAAATSPQRP